MKKGLTEMVFILDRSGSMSGLESDTIGGFNSMIALQKKEEGEAIVSTVLFDNRYELIHDRFNIQSVGEMTDEEYYTRGSTALLDAMGSSIQKTINVQKHLPEDEKAEKVIFVIITDGYENSSCEFSYEDVRKMVEQQQEKYGWEFMFLGANIDAISEGRKFGIREERAVRYCSDEPGTQMNYEVVGEALCEMRSCSKMSEVGAEWKEEIEKDYASRGEGHKGRK
ncbi:MAG: VWA domain-containing protein [Eubacteriales bacterium]|nr:VWA domain-containing protein [Eubacteriales bacterium]